MMFRPATCEDVKAHGTIGMSAGARKVLQPWPSVTAPSPTYPGFSNSSERSDLMGSDGITDAVTDGPGRSLAD